MHARFARYAFEGDAVEIARRAEEGMLPIFQSQPGFKAYSIFESDGEIYSFSVWESADAAAAANAAAAQWVSKNLADKVQMKESRIGEVHLATSLGISQKAGISV
jgi:heme-degrading monooxygenase HmoA